MNTLKKLTTLGVVTLVGVILFLYPKPFKETYKDVQVYENGNKVSKIDIKLDGKYINLILFGKDLSLVKN